MAAPDRTRLTGRLLPSPVGTVLKPHINLFLQASNNVLSGRITLVHSGEILSDLLPKPLSSN